MSDSSAWPPVPTTTPGACYMSAERKNTTLSHSSQCVRRNQRNMCTCSRHLPGNALLKQWCTILAVVFFSLCFVLFFSSGILKPRDPLLVTEGPDEQLSYELEF